MTDALANEYNWDGKCAKNGLKDKYLFKIIMENVNNSKITKINFITEIKIKIFKTHKRIHQKSFAEKKIT
jgi:hypothetical protein